MHITLDTNANLTDHGCTPGVEVFTSKREVGGVNWVDKTMLA